MDDVGARFDGVVTYHDSCHALRELGIKDGPRRLLANVRGLELREMDAAEECCGFGGTFSVKFPEVSGGMARTKIDSILRTGATHRGLDRFQLPDAVAGRDSPRRPADPHHASGRSSGDADKSTMSAAFHEKIKEHARRCQRCNWPSTRATGRLMQTSQPMPCDGDRLPDYQELRTQANAIKKHTIENLDYYLEQFEAQCDGARRQGDLLPGRDGGRRFRARVSRSSAARS